jgi:phosphoglycerate dehydrogenase-like enzyme
MKGLTLLVLADPAAPYLRGLDELPDDTTVIVTDDEERAKAAAPRADVILNGGFVFELFHHVWPLAEKLQWVHSLSAGVEASLSPEFIESPIPLTNARGVFARSLGEWSMAAMLFFAKDLRGLVRKQDAGKWVQFTPQELHGATLGVVGYGEIGRACAERARAFGMRVLAYRRRGSDHSLAERTFVGDGLKEMLAECDYVVVSAPLTEQTRGLIGRDEFAVLKKTAVILNVGRGPVIDEAAMIEALRSGSIRGAALDVFDVEPLPEGHPFWGMENVLISPHCADRVPGWIEDAVALFVDNFGRFDRGEPLKNMVDKRAGY